MMLITVCMEGNFFKKKPVSTITSAIDDAKIKEISKEEEVKPIKTTAQELCDILIIKANKLTQIKQTLYVERFSVSIIPYLKKMMKELPVNHKNNKNKIYQGIDLFIEKYKNCNDKIHINEKEMKSFICDQLYHQIITDIEKDNY